MKTVYHKPRPVQVTFSRFINPFWWLGNADRPYDERFTFFHFVIDERSPHWLRKLLFAIRNPGHNFTHYIIGVAHVSHVRVGIAPSDVWNPDGGLNWSWSVVSWWRALPFVSYKGNGWEAYIGWRDGGNFGIALRK